MESPTYRSPKTCLGWDRCDICGQLKPLWQYWDKDIEPILLEILPDGRPELRCADCIPETSDDPGTLR